MPEAGTGSYHPKDGGTPYLGPTKVSGAENDDALPDPSLSLRSSLSGRYSIVSLHAKGGLGEIFVATDIELSRQVALKRIVGEFADDTASRRRFVMEAEITAHLEHPGVVPVHGMGVDESGRPCYAMRLVRGETLAEAIQRFHHSRASKRRPRSWESDREFRQLLHRFIALCNTVAYAHSQGIIHRDIKPLNVMLGPYGETLLVDWGLAKRIASPSESPAEDETDGTRKPSSHTDGESQKAQVDSQATGAPAPQLTRVGSALGTPAYMSPEQAAGKWDEVGPAADIYSLGATLYTIITGTAPFQESSADVLLSQVRKGDFPRPRQVHPKVPRALEAICLKAMATDPAARYGSALDLAADLEQWLAGERVSAYAEPITDRIARFFRRRRSLVVGTAALLWTAVVLLSIGNVVISRERDEKARCHMLAEHNFQLAREAVDQMLTRVAQEKLANIPHMKRLQRELLRDALRFYQNFLYHRKEDPLVQHDIARAYSRVGDIHRMLGEFEASRKAYEASITISRRLVQQFPDSGIYRRELAGTLNNFANLLSQTRHAKEAEAAHYEAFTIKQQLAEDFPDEPSYQEMLGRSYNNRGEQLRRAGRSREAEQAFLKAISIHEALANKYPDRDAHRNDLAMATHNAAILFFSTNRPKTALEYFSKALALYRQLVKDAPDDPERRSALARTLSGLGVVCRSQARLDQAAEYYREASDILEGLSKDFPLVPDYRGSLGVTLNNLANVYVDRGQLEQAEEILRRAIQIEGSLVADHIDSQVYRRQLALSQHVLGVLLLSQDRLDEAEEQLSQARQIRQRLVEESPQVPGYQSRLADTLQSLASLERKRGRIGQAENLIRQAIEHQQIAVRAASSVPQHRAQLQQQWKLLATLLLERNAAAEAAQAASQLARTEPQPGKATLWAAGILAQCVRAVRQNSDGNPNQKNAQAEKWTRQAINLLRLAIRNHAVETKQLQRQPEFEPIRSDRRFRDLLKLAPSQ